MADFNVTETVVVVNDTGVKGPKGDKGDIGNVGPRGPVGLEVVEHGSNANLARPDAPVVYWIGSVLPNNAIATDLWYQT